MNLVSVSIAVVGSLLVSSGAVPAAPLDYESQVRPILAAHCFKCHGAKKQSGDLRLDSLSSDFAVDRRAAERWHDVRDALNLGEMPPPEEPALTRQERQLIVRWISEQLKALLAAQNSTDGRIVLRRLNRTEYQNTMCDLLGIETDYARNLPPERLSQAGFQNDGSALQMSGLQLEYYLEAARDGLRKALVTGDQPVVYRQKSAKSIKDENRGSSLLDDDEQFVARLMEYPAEGEFLIRVRARARLAEGRGYPQLRVAVGYRADVRAPRAHLEPVDVTSESWQSIEFRSRIENYPQPSKTQSKFPGLLIWLDNAYAEGRNKPLKAQRKKRKKNQRAAEVGEVQLSELKYPVIEIESVEFVGPVFDQWPPEHHSRILFSSSKRNDDEASYADEVLARFMQRAYRRPVREHELTPYRRFFRSVRASSDSFEEAMSESLAMVLISPDFLYLFEPSDTRKRTLTDWELASRLSYLLWSTMPDERLFELARSGKLREPEVLRSEVTRMLDDGRSWQFVEQFAQQWLDVGAVDRVAVNPEFYPEFNNELKQSMRQETLHFFAEILYRDLSALNFLDAEFTMLNEPLAKHYGLVGPRGSAFERVTLGSQDPRGGVLTTGSFLLGNSTGDDSHPVKRAVWIRERLLDDPPADPPPNVPNLDSIDPDFLRLSVREQLRMHRNDDACKDCHRGIDPWGIALEDFGADGLWRDDILRKKSTGKGFAQLPVESSTTLPDGSSINGIDELKAYLLDKRRDQFSAALTRKLLTYALGRNLELTDEPTVKKLTAQFIDSDYRLSHLIQRIVASEPFQSK